MILTACPNIYVIRASFVAGLTKAKIAAKPKYPMTRLPVSGPKPITPIPSHALPASFNEKDLESNAFQALKEKRQNGMVSDV